MRTNINKLKADIIEMRLLLLRNNLSASERAVILEELKDYEKIVAKYQ